MAACRSCGAWIVWAVTEKGKRMPVEPSDGGNIFLKESLFDEPPTATVVEPGKGTHASHFATCPDAPEWRKS